MANELTPLFGHNRFGTASVRKTFGNIVISIVGSGVLGLPYTFRVSGWAIASAAVVLSAILTYYCMILLVKCKNKLEDEGHPNILTYGDVGSHTYGNILLAWFRSLAGLAPFSIFADVCNVLAMAFVLRDDFHNFQGLDKIVAYRQWKGLPFAMGIAVYCYEGFGMTLTLEASMKKPHKFGRVLGQAFSLITLLYTSFGVFGYLAFGDETQDIITLNLPNDWSTVAVKFGLCIALFFTFPVMMYPVQEIVERKLMLLLFFQNNAVLYPRLFKIICNAVRGGVVLIVAVIAVSIPGFGLFISLIGSTVCAMLAFVFPAVFHLYVFKDSISFLHRGVDLCLIIVGISFAMYGTYSSCIGTFGKNL